MLGKDHRIPLDLIVITSTIVSFSFQFMPPPISKLKFFFVIFYGAIYELPIYNKILTFLAMEFNYLEIQNQYCQKIDVVFLAEVFPLGFFLYAVTLTSPLSKHLTNFYTNSESNKFFTRGIKYLHTF